MAVCRNCGHQLAIGDKFCSLCGTDMQNINQVRDNRSVLDVDISIGIVLKGNRDENTEIEIWLAHLNKTITTKVPNTISAGYRLRLRGLGHTSPDGRKGDAYVYIANVQYENVQQTNEEPQRKTVYEGNLHKCPNCGEVLKSFVAHCPTCGHEFRGSKSSDSLNELSWKLENASSDSVKSNLIRNFPLSNTREDILEFMILASTNIENSFQQEVSEAWSVKFEQAYEKSKILFGDTPEFSRCYELFLRKREENRKFLKRKERKTNRLHRKEQSIKKQERSSKFFEKNKDWIVVLVLFAVVFLFIGSWSIPHAINEYKLEKLVAEVEECIDNEEFELARIKTNQIIDDSGWSSESKNKWDDIRKSLLETIERQEVITGNKIYVGVSQDDMIGKNYSEVITYFEQQGFTNVKTEVIDDLVTGWLTSDGEVEKVTINGSTDFNEESAYEAYAEIVVFYHTFK